MGTTIKVIKSDYEVYEYLGGYLGICKTGSHGGVSIWGGDSAWEDCYDKELANEVYNNWNGTLTHCGNDSYGESGFTING